MMPYVKVRRSKLLKVGMAVILSLLTIRLIAPKERLQWLFCAESHMLARSYLCQSVPNEWNLLYHLGGNGPWIARQSANEASLDLPASCTLEQVHMLSRHAERYPTKRAGARHITLLEKLKHQAYPRGSLEFLNEWTYFTDITNPIFENLTSSGPYAGTLQAAATGRKLKSRYHHLVPAHTTIDFWTCSSPRDIETARCFAAGFFGQDWESTQNARLHIIPETSDRGANTLTPSQTCLNYIHDKLEGHDYGHAQLAQWQGVFSPAISSRLRKDAGNLQLNPIEIYSMMELCGFEILARGTSPWCDVFTPDEWLQFEYARDILHFYRAGPGNKYAGVMGWLWLNATLEILRNDSKTGVYFSFVHDSDLVSVIASMGILDEPGNAQHLPIDHIRESRRWRTSDVTPMGGHIILEKMTCDPVHASESARQSYVRLIVNDGIFDLQEVIGGVGFAGAPSLQEFDRFTQRRGDKFGSFVDVCGLSSETPSRISFYER